MIQIGDSQLVAHSSNWLADRKNNDDDNKLGQKKLISSSTGQISSSHCILGIQPMASTLLYCQSYKNTKKGGALKIGEETFLTAFVDVKGCRPINKQYFDTNLSNRCNTIQAAKSLYTLPKKERKKEKFIKTILTFYSYKKTENAVEILNSKETTLKTNTHKLWNTKKWEHVHDLSC